MTNDPIAPLAAKLGMAPGAFYTVAIGMVFALALTLTGPPAAFSQSVIVPSNGGLGNLAAPAQPVAVATPAPAPPTTSLPVPAAPIPVQPAVTTPVPTTRPVVVSPTPPTTEPAQPSFGDTLASGRVPGRVVGAVLIGDGLVVTVDRDDADPQIVRLDEVGARVGSLVITDRDVSGATDIGGIDADADGSLVVLLGGPAEVVRVPPDGSTVESVATLPDLPPCAVPLPVPVACEPGLTDNAPDPADVTIDGDRILVSDPGQGVLWTVEPDGSIEVAASEESYRAGETSSGLRGLAERGSSIVATVDDQLVEITEDAGATTVTGILTLPGSAVGVDTNTSRDVAVLLADGDIVRLDRADETLRTPRRLDAAQTLALGPDSMWLAAHRQDAGDSLVTNISLTRSDQ